MRYLDADTIALCHAAMRDGTTLDDLAGRLHIDTELLGRLLQLPALKPVPVDDALVDDELDLWRVEELDGVL